MDVVVGVGRQLPATTTDRSPTTTDRLGDWALGPAARPSVAAKRYYLAHLRGALGRPLCTFSVNDVPRQRRRRQHRNKIGVSINHRINLKVEQRL